MNNNLPGSILRGAQLLLLQLILSGMVFTAQADEHDESSEALISPLFQTHERLNMRLEAPFKQLFRQRKEERPYFPAVLSYSDAEGKDVRLELKVRVRGNFRAKKENCKFPPLKLNFKKNSTEGTIFEGEDKLKLVTHCQSSSSKYEQFVLLEYLNYRMQNLVTDYSLRPRLATVEYYDTDRQKVTDTKVAFLIEDQKRMAKRVGAELVKVKRIEKTEYNQELLHLATVFEYLIGNTDYSVILGPKGDDCCHNIIPLKAKDGAIVPVPYDFDVTGIVNPPYASPPEHLGIRSLRQRLYRGYCQNTEGFKNTFAVFNDNRDAILGLYTTDMGLQEKLVKSTVNYLTAFFDAISSDDRIVSEFIEKCRT